ncbi:MAG: glycosyltransferase family 39 protein [Kiritimatiellae bacterium]|nr:glycosyltransferase family 39 protein [Kiritimatiellia bacterium]
MREGAVSILRDRQALCISLWILLLSVALRLFFVGHATWIPVADTRDYHVLAWNLASGEGYQQVYHGDRPAYEGFTFYAYRMPGYSAILAAWYSIFGWDPYHAMVLNTIADMVTGLCILLIALQLFGKRVALLAQGLWGIQILWTTSLMTESVFTCLLMILILCLVQDRTFRSGLWALCSGLLLAGTFFVRPIASAVYGAIVLKSLIRRDWRRKTILLLVVMLLPSVIGVGLWSYRNYRLLNAFVPFATQFGRHNSPSFNIDFDRVYVDLRTKGCNEAQINKALTGQILRAAAADPVNAVKVYARRALDLFTLPPLGFVERGLLWIPRFSGDAVPTWSYTLYRNLYYQYHVVYLFAGLGLALILWQRINLQGLGLCVLAFVLLSAVVSPGNIRYAAPLYPAICIFASVGASTLLVVLRNLLKEAPARVEWPARTAAPSNGHCHHAHAVLPRVLFEDSIPCPIGAPVHDGHDIRGDVVACGSSTDGCSKPGDTSGSA